MSAANCTVYVRNIPWDCTSEGAAVASWQQSLVCVRCACAVTSDVQTVLVRGQRFAPSSAVPGQSRRRRRVSTSPPRAVSSDAAHAQHVLARARAHLPQVIAFRASPSKSRGFGFVTFATPSAAAQAVTQLNGALLGGRALSVSMSEPREPRFPRAQHRPPFGAQAAKPSRQTETVRNRQAESPLFVVLPVA